MASLFGQTRFTVFMATLTLVGLMCPGAGQAQTTNITPSGLNTQVGAPTTLPNGTINYDITGGTRPGNGPNLFHSFGEFSVPTNNIANFLNETATPTTNILSRVTGGNPSNIFGTLRTTDFGAANLYLINPAGVIFGPTAELNVGGSFAASTADYLKMTDGAQFHTDPVQPSVLTIANVAAFGFTSPRPVAISVQGPATLQAPTDQTLSLIGGDITIMGSTLRAASGQINIASVSSAGEVVPNQPGQAPSLDVTSFTSLGQITESSLLDPVTGATVARSNLTVSSAAGLGAGTLVVRGGGLTMHNSFMNAQNAGTVNANPIGVDIAVTGDLILRNTSNMLAQTINAEGAGIRISADRLVLESTATFRGNFTGFNASSFGSGRAGDIVIAARVIEAHGNTGIGSNTFASGRAGDIQITADQLILDSLFQGTYLSSTLDSVVLETNGIGEPGAGTGQGGAVRLDVRDLQVLNGAQIGTFTQGSGNGGTINVRANSLLISGVNLSSGTPSSLLSSAIGPAASGNSGDVLVQADSIVVEKGGLIIADLLSGSPGIAGNIALVTHQLTMTPDSAITSSAQTGEVGKAGAITIDGPGSAPTTIAGGTIQAQSNTSESSGKIMLRASGDLTLLGTTVSVKNTGPGSAGSINLLAGNDLLVRNSQVSTQSVNASGGKIELTAPHIIRLVDSTLESSVLAGSKGGDIFIDPQLVVIQNSKILANADTGAGGNIFITATGAVLVDPNSKIDASAGPAGISGSVNINSPIQVLSGALVPLKLAYSQAGLSGDRCAADPTGQFSSFVQTGRDGVPQVPGALSPSPLSFLETLTSGSLGSPLPNWAAVRLGLDFVSVDDSTLFRFHSACRS